MDNVAMIEATIGPWIRASIDRDWDALPYAPRTSYSRLRANPRSQGGM